MVLKERSPFFHRKRRGSPTLCAAPRRSEHTKENDVPGNRIPEVRGSVAVTAARIKIEKEDIKGTTAPGTPLNLLEHLPKRFPKPSRRPKVEPKVETKVEPKVE